MFAVIAGKRLLNNNAISNEEIERIQFDSFVGFIHLREVDLNLVPTSELGFQYLEGIHCLNTETGLLGEVVFKLVPTDSVKEKFDHCRYIDLESYGVLKSGNNYLNRDCHVEYSLYQQAKTDWNNFKNWVKSFKNTSNKMSDDISALCSDHTVLFFDPYNNDYKTGNRVYESTVYDLKTDTLFQIYGIDKIYKFERFLNGLVMECTVFDNDGFIEKCELNVSNVLSSMVKLGMYFKV